MSHFMIEDAMFKVYRAHKYAWTYLGDIEAKNFEEAVKLARAEYPDFELRVSDGTKVVTGLGVAL